MPQRPRARLEHHNLRGGEHGEFGKQHARRHAPTAAQPPTPRAMHPWAAASAHSFLEQMPEPHLTAAVMLSQPMPRASLGSLARQALSSSDAMSRGSTPLASRWCTKSTTCWLQRGTEAAGCMLNR